MKAFKDKVAVVTGAASGIGRGIAERCAKEGMKVVIADIEKEALSGAAKALEAEGATILAVVTDVAKVADVEALARKTMDTFGEVHLLFNNAGVGGAGGAIWENTMADWQWVMGVNLWGVIHGIHTFVPIMLEQDVDCHIVNTASIFGLIAGPGTGIYKVTKQGVVAISETLHFELAMRESKINVSVLCPGAVNTGIVDSGRNRPSELQNEAPEEELTPEMEQMHQMMLQVFKEGMPPNEAADIVFRAIENKQLYVLTHPELKENFKIRADNILHERNPEIMSMFDQLKPEGS
ncbi:MAG: SDR family NAD(P)-dependent oxidoreductase [Desulfobacterales bacterium]